MLINDREYNKFIENHYTNKLIITSELRKQVDELDAFGRTCLICDIFEDLYKMARSVKSVIDDIISLAWVKST